MKRNVQLLVLLIGVCFGNIAQAQQIQGNWESKHDEPLENNAYYIKEYSFSEDKWESKFTLLVTSNGKLIPVYSFRSLGTYSITGESGIVDGAKDIVMVQQAKYLTLLTSNENIIEDLGFSGCQLELGAEKDISNSGCSFIRSVSVSNVEYNIIKQQGSYLYLGRPNSQMNLVSNRPTVWSVPLVRKYLAF